MAKNEYGDQLDSPELVERCLNCPFPFETCSGEYKCKAETRKLRLDKEEVVEYAIKRGYTTSEIERETDGYITQSFADGYKLKVKRGIGHKWGKNRK